MLERVNKILSKIFDMKLSDVHPLLTKDNIYKWDSLVQMEIVTALENEFEMQMTMEEIISIDSVQKIYDVLANHGVDVHVIA